MSQNLIQHLTTKRAWEEALPTGNYSISSRDKTLAEVGFIHCVFPDQLEEIAGFLFRKYADELVVLNLEIEKLAASGVIVLVEAGGNGQNYPHIYGPIPCALVDLVTPALMDTAGKLVLY